MRVRWSGVLLAMLALLALAYNRQIGERLAEMRLGEMWEEFCGEIWGTPPLGRFAIVAMVLGLLYVTAFVLIQGRRRQ